MKFYLSSTSEKQLASGAGSYSRMWPGRFSSAKRFECRKCGHYRKVFCSLVYGIGWALAFILEAMKKHVMWLAVNIVRAFPACAIVVLSSAPMSNLAFPRGIH